MPKTKHVMKSILLVASLAFASSSMAQIGFNPEIDFEMVPDRVIVPPSPLTTQILFIGGVDMVQTTATYGNPAGQEVAKQWHDFIGFTPDTVSSSTDLGWITVNHEMIQSNDYIGDGGGMTAFKVKRDPNTDTLIVVNQTLSDGRSGLFFNVDFVNTVGETGMNCGGITSAADGRIWTAEEWFRSNNASISAGGAGVTDTSDFTITGSGIAAADGQTISKFQNFNWMVEVDPREAVAVRKQYNWGRQPFEGGVVMPDNQTVYLGSDDTPGFLTKFVATTPGDFTQGVTYVYKESDPAKWVVIDNSNFNNMLEYKDAAVAVGATMFNRLEWVVFNKEDGNVYLTETGRDNPGSRWADELADGAEIADHHYTRATAQGTTPDNGDYWDYYGRVLKLDVTTDDISIHLEAGPHFANGATVSNYPDNHLTNPDGLGFLYADGKTWMLICEDLNGISMGRMPEGVCNRTCELYILDMSISSPTIDDLVRIASTPLGAEITGVTSTPDGMTVLINSQHPSDVNPYPYNNSLTIAITGWAAVPNALNINDEEITEGVFDVYPNPVARTLRFNQTTDVGLYDASGKLVKVERNTNFLDITGFAPGIYYIRNKDNQTKKVIVQ